MIPNLDKAIFVGFLIINLVVGLFASYGIKTMREYAVGDRKFSTATIACTMAATWLSGRYFFMAMEETFDYGLYFIWTSFGDLFGLLIVAYIIVPRMKEFFDNMSIAEAMGGIYGKQARIFSALCASLAAVGKIAAQLKVSGMLFTYCFGWDAYYGILIGGLIITLYSALGGIRSVTFTDVMQLITFGTMLPTLAFVIFGKISDWGRVVDVVSSSELYDYKQVFNIGNPTAREFFIIFAMSLLPNMAPAAFQRVIMSKDTKQATSAVVVAAFITLFVSLLLCGVAVLVFATDTTGLKSSQIVEHILFKESYVGLRGFIFAGIMAMSMSTVDSFINSSSVVVVHDILKPLGVRMRDELFVTRLASLIFGVTSIWVAVNTTKSLLSLWVITNTLYLPIIDVVFVTVVLGFRSSHLSGLSAMYASAFTVVALYILGISATTVGVVASFVNLVVLFGTHYLLRQPGGWVGIRDDAPLKEIRRERQMRWKYLTDSVKNFTLKGFLARVSPDNELVYVYTGLFCYLSLYANLSTIGHVTQSGNAELLAFLSPSVLFSATILISYPLWLQRWKESKMLIQIAWNLVAFYGLVFTGFLLAFMTGLSAIQVMITIINLIIISVLVRWEWALFMMCSGAFIAMRIAHPQTEMLAPAEMVGGNMVLIYGLLLFSSLLLVFIKPKQQREALLLEKVDHMRNTILAQEQQVRHANMLKSEFVRHVSHEYHTPMTGIMSMSQMLSESYDSLTDEERRGAADIIFKSFVRLESFDSNIASLARLSQAKYHLQYEKIDFAELVLERLSVCKSLYGDDYRNAGEISTNLEERIAIKGDRYYLAQMIDNLIINAMAYCNGGNISLTLERVGNYALRFCVRDEGVGVPQDELLTIFDEFMVSSKTQTSSGGRGVGLALCKKVAEVHEGNIFADSDGKSWTVFHVNLPIK